MATPKNDCEIERRRASRVVCHAANLLDGPNFFDVQLSAVAVPLRNPGHWTQLWPDRSGGRFALHPRNQREDGPQQHVAGLLQPTVWTEEYLEVEKGS